MLADLAVLSQDIFAIPVEALPATTSVLTMIGGRIVYDALTRPPQPQRGRSNHIPSCQQGELSGDHRPLARQAGQLLADQPAGS